MIVGFAIVHGLNFLLEYFNIYSNTISNIIHIALLIILVSAIIYTLRNYPKFNSIQDYLYKYNITKIDELKRKISIGEGEFKELFKVMLSNNYLIKNSYICTDTGHVINPLDGVFVNVNDEESEQQSGRVILCDLCGARNYIIPTSKPQCEYCRGKIVMN